jgi:acetylornithine deacetylase
MQSRGLTQPVYIALSYDEELGCQGVLPMVRHLADLATPPRLCIVGEPTEMRVINAHKGIRSYRVIITGLAGHSSAPHLGASAIFAAAELISFIAGLAEEVQREGVSDHRFFPPYTTFNIGEISGGSATNIIPASAEFSWEFRPIPGFDADGILARFTDHAMKTVLPRLRETAAEADIQIIEMSNAPPLLAEEGSDAETFVMQLARQNQTETAAYATEAGQFQAEAEIPTVVCGPGSIDQAHKPDEYITLSQIAACEQFMGRFLDAVCKD